MKKFSWKDYRNRCSALSSGIKRLMLDLSEEQAVYQGNPAIDLLQLIEEYVLFLDNQLPQAKLYYVEQCKSALMHDGCMKSQAVSISECRKALAGDYHDRIIYQLYASFIKCQIQLVCCKEMKVSALLYVDCCFLSFLIVYGI
jgi:hypothetical protein